MMRFIFLIHFIFISVSLHAMNIYPHIIPTWQSTKLTTVLTAPDLADKFKSLRLHGTTIPLHIETSINTIVGNPVGKAIIADIVSALEPKKEYIDFIEQIATQMNGYILAGRHVDAVNLAMPLLHFIHSKNPATSATLFNPADSVIANTALGKLGDILLEGLTNYTSGIALPHTTLITSSTYSDPAKIALVLYGQINGVIKILNDELNTLRFQFKDDADYYNSETKTIAVTNSSVKASVISGPRLITCATVVGILTQYEDILPDERFCHEILHYSHLTLYKQFLGGISTIGTPFVSIAKFHPFYAGVLSNIWTNHEELRTITGLFEIGGKLYFDPRNESSYLAAKGKKLRCSHSLSYCTKVPIYFCSYISDLLFNHTELSAKPVITTNFKLLHDYDVPYVKQIDDLI